MGARANIPPILCILVVVLGLVAQHSIGLKVYRSHDHNATTVHVQFLDKLLTVRHPQVVQEILSKLSPYPDEITVHMANTTWTSPSPTELLYIQPDNFTQGLFTRIQVLEWMSSSPSVFLDLSFIGMYFNPSVVFWKNHLFLTSRKVNDSKIRRHFSGSVIW